MSIVSKSNSLDAWFAQRERDAWGAVHDSVTVRGKIKESYA